MRILDYSTIKDVFKNYITIQLFGPEGTIENIGRLVKFQTHLRVKAHMIYKRLAILQHSHLFYINDPKFNLHDFHVMKKAFDEACNKMIPNALKITDENALNAEKIEGDDIAQVRTRVLDEVDVQEFKNNSNDSNNIDLFEMKVSCSYFVRNQNKY